MHILIVGSYAPSLLNFRGSLISDLIERGYKVTAAAPGCEGDIASALQKLGASTVSVPIENASFNPARIFQGLGVVRTLLRDVRPDAVIAYTIMPVILCSLAARAGNVKRMVALITGLGYAFSPGPQLTRLIARTGALFLYRLALSRADVILFQNIDDYHLFKRFRIIRRTGRAFVVSGSGIDLERFEVAPLPSGPSFLMVARLLRSKGVLDFAAATKLLQAQTSDAKCRLAGFVLPSPDSVTDEELDHVRRLGVEFLGKLDDVRPAIRDCSVYVLPSYYREGVPRSILEAMAMGRAVITTDMPGCRETVVEGVNGFLVPPRDPEALFRAMLRFVEDPALAARMGAESRRIAEERYDVRKVNADLMRHAGLQEDR